MRPHDLTRCQLLIRFGYDGARFQGVQPQAPGVPTAGLALKMRLQAAAAETPVKALNFAARTDAGVHALGNLATCYLRDVEDERVEPLLRALTAPRDDGLVDVRAWRVPPTVHARGIARGKHYRYVVADGVDAPVDAPVDDVKTAWAIAPSLDVDRMRAAARHLVGTHDFASLRGGNCSASSTVKTLASVEVVRERESRAGGRVTIDVVGDAFLRKMMRNLAALLVEVGSGWREPDDVVAVLDARDRQAAGICAPAHGLTLVAVGSAWPEDGSLLLPELRPELRPELAPGMAVAAADDD